MKKILTLTLAILLTLTVVACGNAPPASGTPTATPPQADTPSLTPDNSGSTFSDDSGDTNTPEPPPSVADPQITITNNAGSTFHLVTIQMVFGQYDTSANYDVIEDGVTVVLDLFEANWERNYMLGALEMDGGFPVHEYMLPDGIPIGSTIILLANNEYSIVASDGSVSN